MKRREVGRREIHNLSIAGIVPNFQYAFSLTKKIILLQIFFFKLNTSLVQAVFYNFTQAYLAVSSTTLGIGNLTI